MNLLFEHSTVFVLTFFVSHRDVLLYTAEHVLYPREKLRITFNLLFMNNRYLRRRKTPVPSKTQTKNLRNSCKIKRKPLLHMQAQIKAIADSAN